MENVPFLWISAGASAIALLFVAYLVQYVLSRPQGTETMIQISRLVQVGAAAFMRREYTYVYTFVAIIAAAISTIGIMNPELGLGWRTAVAFVCGSMASTLAGFLGMYIATRSNARTAAAAESGGTNAALDVAISGEIGRASCRERV